MNIGLLLFFLAILAAVLLVASSNCADPWITGSDSGKGGPLECGVKTAEQWRKTAESEGYANAADTILRDAKDSLSGYYRHYLDR